MLAQTIIYSLLLSVSSLRVQQRGADVTIAKNQTVQLKKVKSTHEAGVGGASPGCTAWAEGDGPIYMCSAKDLIKIFLFQLGHPWRCVRGVLDPDDTVATWGTGTTYWSGYRETRATSWEQRYDCLLANPMKFKALWDPFALFDKAESRFNVERLLDPFGVWSDGSDRAALVKRYYSTNTAYMTACTGSGCTDDDCTDSGRYRTLIDIFKYTTVTAGAPQLLAGEKMSIRVTYKREQFNHLWELRTDGNGNGKTRYVHCLCAHPENWDRTTLAFNWKFGNVACQVRAQNTFFSGNTDPFGVGISTRYDFPVFAGRHMGWQKDSCQYCDTLLMVQQYYLNGWDPYSNMENQQGALVGHAVGVVTTDTRPGGTWSGTNDIHLTTYCGAGSSLMDDDFGDGSWAQYDNINNNKYTKNFETPGIYNQQELPGCEDVGPAR